MARVLLINDSAALLHRLQKQLRPLLAERRKSSRRPLSEDAGKLLLAVLQLRELETGHPALLRSMSENGQSLDLGLEDFIGGSEPVRRNDARGRQIQAADRCDGVPFGQKGVPVVGLPAAHRN